MAVLIAIIAISIFIYRSPFSLGFVALFLLGKMSNYEYAVMARNYGISMLFMFLFAACYPTNKNKGVVLGVILALLANCNVHSAILSGAYLIFWGGDIFLNSNQRFTKEFYNFLKNCAIVGGGIFLCFISVYPPVNNAAVLEYPRSSLPHLIVKAICLPAISFPGYDNLWNILKPVSFAQVGLHFAGSILVFCCLLGLINRPSAFAAALAALVGLSLFFELVYPGSYRHKQLSVIFLITMYWMSKSPSVHNIALLHKVPKKASSWLTELGGASLVLYLILQLIGNIGTVHNEHNIFADIPESQSRHFADFINSSPNYHDAIIIADPDFLVESMPYYVTNQTYIIRENRWGKFSYFKKVAQQSLTLRNILDTAITLHQEKKKPVLIVMAKVLYTSMPEENISENYNQDLHILPADADYFLHNTTLVQKRIRTTCDESYDVYALNVAATGN